MKNEDMMEIPVDRDRVEVYEDGLTASSKLVVRNCMGSGAAAIILGHIRKLYKIEMGKLPMPEMAVETKIQRFERLVKEKTGLAKSTTSRYAQLAEVFLTKKQDIQQLIEDSVNGLDINDNSLATIVDKIGADLEVTALYHEYGVLPEIEDKQGGGDGKSLKELFMDGLDKLTVTFGEKALDEGYGEAVIVAIQDDLTALKSKAEKALGAEEVKAKTAKENRRRVVTKKTKKSLELAKVMELHDAEMKEMPPEHVQEMSETKPAPAQEMGDAKPAPALEADGAKA